MKKYLTTKILSLSALVMATLFFAQEGKTKKFEIGKTYTVEQLKDANGIIRCGTTENEQLLQAQYPDRLTEKEFEAWINPLIENSKNSRSQANGIITIPVVVHVIHSGQAYGVAPNITDTQVQSQIAVLNNDYRRLAGSPGFNNSPVGADVMIQFALAKVDPKGNPTTGINHINMCKPFWTKPEISTILKPATIWDPTKYMNMWSVKFGGVSANLLGYAQFPSNSGLPGMNANGGQALSDGVVSGSNCFGTIALNDGTFTLSAPYNLGRTMTHEIGHFLGLRHIWGDANCGTDYCADTPTAHTANYTCNTNIASCDNPAVMEMVQNYMDYTNDACMNIFTIEQKARMTAVMNNSPRRMELKTSTTDVALPLVANDAEVQIDNPCAPVATACGTVPTSTTVTLLLHNRGTNPITSATINYNVSGHSGTYNFTGNIAPNRYATFTVVIPAGTLSGNFSATITSVNGTTDGRASNNNTNYPFVTNAGPIASTGNLTFTLQNDYWGSETTWTLKNSAGTTVYSGGPYSNVSPPPSATYLPPLPAPIVQNWTLQPGCYVFNILDSGNDGITQFEGYYKLENANGILLFKGDTYTNTQSRALTISVLGTVETELETFSIYPNPAADILYVKGASTNATYELHNAVGQIVQKGNLNKGTIEVSSLIKGVYNLTIKDKNKNESIKFIKK